MIVKESVLEISPRPASIPHNHPTIPRDSRGVWFLSGASNSYEFIFVHSTRVAKVIKRVSDGWTKADAESFARILNSVQ